MFIWKWCFSKYKNDIFQEEKRGGVVMASRPALWLVESFLKWKNFFFSFLGTDRWTSLCNRHGRKYVLLCHILVFRLFARELFDVILLQRSQGNCEQRQYFIVSHEKLLLRKCSVGFCACVCLIDHNIKLNPAQNLFWCSQCGLLWSSLPIYYLVVCVHGAGFVWGS